MNTLYKKEEVFFCLFFLLLNIPRDIKPAMNDKQTVILELNNHTWLSGHTWLQ